MVQIIKRIARKLPTLGIKLKQGGMNVTPEQFVKRTVMSAFYLTTGMLLITAGFFSRFEFFGQILAVLTPLLFILLFVYFLRIPDVKARRIMTEINSEIVDAGRFMLVELQSGMSIYESIKTASKNFPHVGKHFHKIIVSIQTGTSLDDALGEAISITPSQDLRRVLWQILNSLKTGSDVAQGLKEVIEQLSKEHLIEVRKYGRKLNPLTMFFMILAVIVPSLGVTMLVVLASLFSIKVDLLTLLIIAAFLGFVQFMFLAVVKSSRPAVNL